MQVADITSRIMKPYRKEIVIEDFTKEDEHEFDVLDAKGLENLNDDERSRYFEILAKHRLATVRQNFVATLDWMKRTNRI